MNSINSSTWLKEKTLLLALMLVVLIPLTSIAQGANGSLKPLTPNPLCGRATA